MFIVADNFTPALDLVAQFIEVDVNESAVLSEFAGPELSPDERRLNLPLQRTPASFFLCSSAASFPPRANAVRTAKTGTCQREPAMSAMTARKFVSDV